MTLIQPRLASLDKCLKAIEYKEGDVCIVTISDTHLCNDDSYGRYDVNGVNSDLYDKVNAFTYAIKIAEMTKATLLCAGDFLDQRVVDGVTLNFAGKILSDIENSSIKNAFFIRGNHEVEDIAEKFSTIHHFNWLLRKTRVVLSPEHTVAKTVGKDIHLFLLPASKNIEEHIVNATNAAFYGNHYNVAVLHGGIQGADLGSIIAPTGINPDLISDMSKKFDVVVCGDFHKFQFVNNLNNVFYCGAPKQMNIGDRGQKRGFQVLNLTKNKMHFVSSYAPKFVCLDYVVGDFVDKAIRFPGAYKKLLKNNICFVKITGSIKDIESIDLDKIKTNLMKKGLAIAVYNEINPIVTRRNSVSISGRLSKKEIIVKYVENKDYDKSMKSQMRHISILEECVNE
jgi:DNA repair exonuclease SbcCD nuclease subunit